MFVTLCNSCVPLVRRCLSHANNCGSWQVTLRTRRSFQGDLRQQTLAQDWIIVALDEVTEAGWPSTACGFFVALWNLISRWARTETANLDDQGERPSGGIGSFVTHICLSERSRARMFVYALFIDIRFCYLPWLTFTACTWASLQALLRRKKKSI